MNAINNRSTVGIGIVGADSTVPLVGQEQLKSRTNYFIGNNRSVALTDIPNYAQVLGREALDGIDVRYLGDQGRLRFDFEVKPGADPSDVVLSYTGVDSIRIDTEGQLRLKLPTGDEVIQRSPAIYQEVDGQKVSRTGSPALATMMSGL